MTKSGSRASCARSNSSRMRTRDRSASWPTLRWTSRSCRRSCDVRS